MWTTLNWTCSRTGYPAPGDQPDLQAAYEETTSRMDKPLHHPPQRAHMPPNTVVEALESGACDSTKTAADRSYSSGFRAAMAVSSRYVDMQHTAPRTV